MLAFDICGMTHRGRVRRRNEDHILVGRHIRNSGKQLLYVSGDDKSATAHGVLLCVADGIGGVAGGEVASRLTLESLAEAFYATGRADSEAIVSGLSEAAHRTNDRVRAYAHNSKDCSEMGSTLAGVCLMGERYWVFNAGDSRVYRFRNGLLKPLSEDDTLAALALRSGAMTLEQAAHSPDANVLTNYVGAAGFRLALGPGPGLRAGDSLLVCSDGLYNMVDEGTLARRLQQFNTAGLANAEQAEQLLALANERGGRDNISLILIMVRHGAG